MSLKLDGIAVKEDVWYGFRRRIFELEGRESWLVEPEEAAPDMPWTWCLEWPTAFVKRTGVPDLLARGFHHVHIHGKFHGNDADQAIFRKFHDMLISLGLAPRPNLIGMSFGGLYALRYAAQNPDRVAAIYLDAPVCSFRNFRYFDIVKNEYPLQSPEDAWTLPGLPVNLTEKLAGIPMLLLYGADDHEVLPAENCEVFLERFKAHGGSIQVIKRNLWGHHPHGLDDTTPIVEFFQSAQSLK